ncbi:MAG: branched-chain amino acid ABC transporter substrate-binding protein [Gaiellales bacterium]
MHRRLLILLTALVGLAIAAPFASAATQGTILLAYEGPMTGDQSANGMDMLRGTKLAVRELNQAGGLLGMKVQLISGNDEADPATGLTVAKAIVAKHPSAVIGPFNSSVGVKNLPTYIKSGVFPVQLTSTDDTSGLGATVQPKNSQISPVEVNWMQSVGAEKVSILWDPSTYTKGMADRMYKALNKKGVLVTKIQIDPTATDFSAVVAQALTNNPDTVYVSTYYPQGAIIAKELAAQAAQGNDARCFMGLANQDPAFITEAGIAASRRCQFSGSPTPAQFGNALSRAYIKNYRAQFGKAPGTWGIYAYDSVRLWANAVTSAGTTDLDAFSQQILHTTDLAGATGPITIAPKSGNRTNVPVAILGVSPAGTYVLDVMSM